MMKITDRKIRVELWMSVCLAIFGCGLLVAGFCVDPLGEIDGSVLIAFGNISTLVGAILGVDYHKNKIIHGISKNHETES